MIAGRCIPLVVAFLTAAGATACSRPAATGTQISAPRADAATYGVTPSTSPAASMGGYSCSFPDEGGRSILARFTLDAGGAHDDQGLPFTVLANSATALILAHARDDLAMSPAGDVGAYVVAIDRRSLDMVQTTVGLKGPGTARHGRCIAG